MIKFSQHDVGWWTRTCIYWLIILVTPPSRADSPAGVLVVLCWLTLVVAVWVRDRNPWPLIVAGLVFSLFISEVAIALAVVALASRVRVIWSVIGGIIAASTLALPIRRSAPLALQITSGFGENASELPGWLRLVFVTVILVVLPVMIGVLRRANRLAAEQLKAFAIRQQELAAEQAAREERSRISQEMHDLLGHKLSLITMQAGALSVTADAGAKVVEKQAEQIRISARQALDELREILGVLGSSTSTLHPQPGLAETRELIRQHHESGAHIDLSDEIGETQLPPIVAAAIYRLVSEALTNADKHAPGAVVRVRLAPGGQEGKLSAAEATNSPTELSEHDSVMVEIINRPSVRAEPAPGNGLGLAGLRERVRTLGGEFRAEPTTEGGFRLYALLPMDSHFSQPADSVGTVDTSYKAEPGRNEGGAR